MDPKNTRKGKEKNLKKDKSAYKYGNKRVRQYGFTIKTVKRNK